MSCSPSDFFLLSSVPTPAMLITSGSRASESESESAVGSRAPGVLLALLLPILGCIFSSQLYAPWPRLSDLGLCLPSSSPALLPPSLWLSLPPLPHRGRRQRLKSHLPDHSAKPTDSTPVISCHLPGFPLLFLRFIFPCLLSVWRPWDWSPCCKLLLLLLYFCGQPRHAHSWLPTA